MKHAQTLYRKIERRIAQNRLRRFQDAIVLSHSKLGTGYGGWFVPNGMLSRQSLCYGVGAGEDISFEIDLINRYGCQVYCFDPTPKAQQHVELLRRNTASGLQTPINHRTDIHYRVDPSSLSHLRYYPVGLWSQDRTMRFYSPQDPAHVSHSIVNLQRTDQYFEADCRTINTVMQIFRHTDLSLLKLDVEGAEYEILASMLNSEIRPAILCVEFDEGYQPIDDGYFSRIETQILRLKQAGYFLTHLDGWNATFVHARTCE